MVFMFFGILTEFRFFAEMVNLNAVRGRKSSSVAARVGSRETPVDVEAGLPRKRARVSSGEASGEIVVQTTEAVTVPAGHAGGSSEVGTSRDAAMEAPRGPSVRDLCRLPTGGGG